MSLLNRITTLARKSQSVKNPRRTFADKVLKKEISVTFECRIEAKGYEDQTLLNVVTSNNIPLPVENFGKCQGALKCHTCRVVLSEEDFDRVTPPDVEELRELQEREKKYEKTSRYACQLPLTSDMDGIVVRVPDSKKKTRGQNDSVIY